MKDRGLVVRAAVLREERHVSQPGQHGPQQAQNQAHERAHCSPIPQLPSRGRVLRVRVIPNYSGNEFGNEVGDARRQAADQGRLQRALQLWNAGEVALHKAKHGQRQQCDGG